MSDGAPWSPVNEEGQRFLDSQHQTFAPLYRGLGCPCCGSAYGRRGCTFDYGCACKYAQVCPDAIKSRSLDDAMSKDEVKAILNGKLRHGEKCAYHCHLEHHPAYSFPSAEDRQADINMRDGW